MTHRKTIPTIYKTLKNSFVWAPKQDRMFFSRRTVLFYVFDLFRSLKWKTFINESCLEYIKLLDWRGS